MKKRKELLKHAWDWVDIPVEISADQARVTMSGPQKVWVENHKGLLGYSTERICFAASEYQIEIIGQRLHLKKSDLGCALVEGTVFSVSYRGECKRDG